MSKQIRQSSRSNRKGNGQLTPRSLTVELGREVENYGQICDVIEHHLLRVIAILQQEIKSEAEKIAEDAKAIASVARRTRSHSMSPSIKRASLPLTASASDVEMVDLSSVSVPSQQASPEPASALNTGSVNLLRRQSTISLSSLHRPQFPHKLDLSAAALRLSPEDISLFSAVSTGRASPVTLAPRSARLMPDGSFPEQLLVPLNSTINSHGVALDLSLPDGVAQGSVALEIGGSAERPIELELDAMDLDMNELFRDPVGTGDDLFTPQIERQVKVEENDFESQLLGVQSSGEHDDLFGPSRAESDSDLLALPLADVSTNAQSPNSMLENFRTDSIIGQNIPTEPFDMTRSAGDSTFDLSAIDLNDLTFIPSNQDASNLKDMEEMLKSSGY